MRTAECESTYRLPNSSGEPLSISVLPLTVEPIGGNTDALGEAWTGRVLDLSPAAFLAVAGGLGTGVIPVTWRAA